MTKTEIAKTISQMVLTHGASKIVNGIIAHNVPIPNIFVKISVKITAYVIGAVMADRLSTHVNRQIDMIVEGVETVRGAVLISGE